MTAPLSRLVLAESQLAPRRQKFLQPGQLIATLVPTEVSTILGSCIAVCMWDQQARIGGINHFLLPFPAAGAAASPRFGNVAMDDLVRRLADLGASTARLRASVFGGACMFAHLRQAWHLGERNAEVALEHLRRAGIEVMDVEVGGDRGRKLRFLTDEGTACSTLI